MSSFYLLTLVFPVIALASGPCSPGSVPSEDGSCKPCDPGSFDHFGICERCFPSTFQPLSGQTECRSCPPNTMSRVGATHCFSCPDGQVLVTNSSCGICPAGQTFDEYYGCRDCEKGLFKSEEGITPCLPCPPNSYSAPGSTECVVCAEDKALLQDGSCGSCPAGKYYDSYQQGCLDCTPGTFTDIENVMRQCYTCGGNSFSNAGAAECIECPRGEYYIHKSDSCERCGAGSVYLTFDGTCEPCRFNEFSRGYTGFCDSCPPGSFARRGSSTCFLCPRGMVFIGDMDGCGRCGEDETYDSYLAKCFATDFVSNSSMPIPVPVEATLMANSMMASA